MPWRALAAPQRALRLRRPPPSAGHQTALATRPSGRWGRVISSWDTPGPRASERWKRRRAAAAAWLQQTEGERPACSLPARPIRSGVDHAMARTSRGRRAKPWHGQDRPGGLFVAVLGSRKASHWRACIDLCRGSSRRTEVAVSRLHRPRASSAGRSGVGWPYQLPSADAPTGTRQFET